MRRLRWAGLAVALVAPTGASAASLGGIASTSLTSSSMATSTGMPAVVAWEAFSGTNGSSLGGSTTDGGGRTWSVWPAGASWTISTNRARSAYADVTGMWIDTGADDVTAVVTLARNGATVFDAGLAVAGSGDAAQFLTCEWNQYVNGSVELWLSDAGGWVQLAAATGLYPGGVSTAPSSVVFRCTITATTLSASINGTTIVSTALDETVRTRHRNASHRWAGLLQYVTSAATFDDFHLDAP